MRVLAFSLITMNTEFSCRPREESRVNSLFPHVWKVTVNENLEVMLTSGNCGCGPDLVGDLSSESACNCPLDQ